MAELEAVIGLEIHVQLSTRTKMFCGCELSFGDEPNVHTCPVCLAHPGVLPVPNEEAIRYALKIAAALDCDVAPRSIFHRKNYFYPDNPKAYQVSQYDLPLAVDGELGGIRIHRAHLEEDAAKTIHLGESGRIHGSGASLVDFNRGGTPLVEIVTEPDLRGAAEAANWARLLRTTVRQLDVSDVNMEEGSLRVDANVSVRPAGNEELGTKTELKNMNSFRFLERGIEAELARQRELVEAGGTVVQETLHFHPEDSSLHPLRSKEEAHDYRYFPEPDLVPLAPTEAMLREARESLPELPEARLKRYRDELGLAEDTAALLVDNPDVAEYFEEVRAEITDADPPVVANWITGDLAGAMRQLEKAAAERPPTPVMAKVIAMVLAKRVSHQAGRQTLQAWLEKEVDPEETVRLMGLEQISDSGELEAIVAAAIDTNPDAAEQIRAGNAKAIGAIVGAVMKETKGRADGGEVNRLIKQKLGV
jgi:aspartyl-tRNA(Asn)/glutamyl-tRNA(Gln) amidotransferase subunit B